MPKSLRNDDTHATPLVEKFIVLFKSTFPTIPILTLDERFTSKMAFQTMIDSGLKKKDRQNKALPILRKVSAAITPEYPELKELLSNMWETLYHSNGVGLAAPQINHGIRLFLVDSLQIVENADEEDKDTYKDEKPIKQVFINPTIVKLEGDEWKYNEGCLSIP
ncbi:unnamed protein product, partial [Darwinula stevensoni]